MQLMTGGDLLARTLAQEGMEYMFGILGGQILPLFDAIKREPRLNLVTPRHEGAGALMAGGYTRASGRVAGVISTVGAGIIYSVTGTADAWAEHLPIFSVSPQVQTWKMYPAQESLQGCYQAEMIAGATRWHCIAYNWERIPSLAQRAIREAQAGEKGPVHMDIPVDVFFESHFVSDRRLAKLLPGPGTSRPGGAVPPDAGSLRESATLLSEARRPVIVAGLSLLREPAWDALSALAGALPAPVAVTPSALSSLDATHEYYTGIAGHPALGSVREMLGQADLVVLLGTTLGEAEEIMGLLPQDRPRVLQTSPEPELLGAAGKVEAALAGDAASIARGLASEVSGGESDRKAWSASCRGSFLDALSALEADAAGSGPGAAAAGLGHCLRPEDLLVLDGQQSTYWGSLLCPPASANTRFQSHGLRGFGYGLPTALGVKLARPRERVFALCDSDALFHHVQELDTARRENIAVAVCVVGEPYDWKGVAEGFNLTGLRAHNPVELASALERSAFLGEASLIDLTGFERS
jgi:acetolactate synthase I/II/III large subunit